MPHESSEARRGLIQGLRPAKFERGQALTTNALDWHNEENGVQ
jgi:hypothetical protein